MTATTAKTPVIPGGHPWVLPLVLSTLGAFPLLGVHFQQMWVRPHYQYFPFVILAIVVVALLRKTDPNREVPRARPRLAVLSLLIGWGVIVVSVLKISPLLCCVGWWISLAGAAWIAPWPAWGAWALVGLLLRLPSGLDVKWIQWLQHFTTTMSSHFLDRLGIDHLQEGNVLAFPERRLFVEEACSGVVSLFTIVATAGVLGAFLKRTFAHTLCLMGVAGFWAGVANVVRVVLMAVCLERMGLDLSEGLRHTLLGVAVFGFTLLMLASSDGLLRFLLGPIDMQEFDAPEGVLDNVAVQWWNVLFWPHRSEDQFFRKPKGQPFQSGPRWEIAMGVIGVALLSVFGLQVWGGIGPFANHLGVKPAIEAVSQESLPLEMAGWTRSQFRTETRDASSQFGHQSHQWTFEKGPQRAVLSIDFPFPEWHPLQVCYAGIGWSVKNGTIPPDGTTRETFSLVKGSENGTLIYDLLDQQGSPYIPPQGSWVHPRWRRLLSGESTPWTLPTFYQLQLLATGDHRPTTEELSACAELFDAFRTAVDEQLLSTPTSPTEGVTP